MAIIAIIFAVIAVVAILVGIFAKTGIGWLVGIISAIISVILFIFSAYYSQDPGEARVLKSWTGEIVDVDVTEGPSWKGIFVDTIDYDIRNQLAAFIGDGKDSYNGQTPNGPQITFQDKDGVTGNLDIVVLYSIEPGSVEDLYRQYSTQENFRTKVIEQDIRSIPRDVAGNYTTLDLLSSRAEVSEDIRAALEKEWEAKGIIVTDVSLQEIRYSDAVRERFEQAQQARTDVETAKANYDRSVVDAQQKVVQAQAEADANAILNASLTPAILQQRYLDVLADANLIVVPQGFTALGTIPGVQ